MILKNKKYGYIDMIAIPLKTSPLYSLIFSGKTIIDALLPMIQIFVTAQFINSSLKVVGGHAGVSSVYLPVAALAGILIYNAVIGALMRFVDWKRRILFRNRLIPEIVAKQANLEYRHIENAKTADLISRIMSGDGFDERIWDMYLQVLNILNFLIYVAGIIIGLFTQVWWVSITMLIAGIPLVYFATKAGHKSYEADKEVSVIDRRVNYLSGVMKDRNAVEERNIYGYTEELNARYLTAYENARKFRQKVTFANFIRMKSAGVFTIAYSAVAMIALLSPVVDGDVTIGMFIALMGSIFGLAQRLSWGVNEILEDLSRKREYFRDFTEFMALEDDSGASARPNKHMSFKEIEFRNVSFAYPGTDRLVLNDVSFRIEYGKHYSFVGTNGAGKTTITRLLTGLYTDYEGEILVDGTLLRDLSQSDIKGLTSVVYQDFARYDMTMYDNIAIGDLDNYDNRQKVESAVKSTGLYEVEKRLLSGLDTPLGKIMKSGADISGGEWQRIAMARAVMGSSPLIILDEPTAALDPLAESMVYRNFEKISRGTAAIFISHRLGSTKLADVIYVLSDGKIAECGSHEELMAADGMYRKMYETQADWYK